MTRQPGGAPSTGADVEGELLLRVLSALLREDVAGWRTRSTAVRQPDGLWLRLPVAAVRHYSADDEATAEDEATARVPAPRVGADGGGGGLPTAVPPSAVRNASAEDEAASRTAVPRQGIDADANHGDGLPAAIPPD
ncbi:hypothetical protein ACWGH2_12695, partial [Streptomyces sp. NPDC054871]